MNGSILEILSYVIVAITTLTMVFGVYAYKLYKIREKRIVNYNKAQTSEVAEDKEVYLYFEEKELLW